MIYNDIFYKKTGMGVKSCTGSFLLFLLIWQQRMMFFVDFVLGVQIYTKTIIIGCFFFFIYNGQKGKKW